MEDIGIKREIIKTKSKVYNSFPSVNCGPIDITKAKNELEWSPSSVVIFR